MLKFRTVRQSFLSLILNLTIFALPGIVVGCHTDSARADQVPAFSQKFSKFVLQSHYLQQLWYQVLIHPDFNTLVWKSFENIAASIRTKCAQIDVASPCSRFQASQLSVGLQPRYRIHRDGHGVISGFEVPIYDITSPAFIHSWSRRLAVDFAYEQFRQKVKAYVGPKESLRDAVVRWVSSEWMGRKTQQELAYPQWLPLVDPSEKSLSDIEAQRDQSVPASFQFTYRYFAKERLIAPCGQRGLELLFAEPLPICQSVTVPVALSLQEINNLFAKQKQEAQSVRAANVIEPAVFLAATVAAIWMTHRLHKAVKSCNKALDDMSAGEKMKKWAAHPLVTTGAIWALPYLMSSSVSKAVRLTFGPKYQDSGLQGLLREIGSGSLRGKLLEMLIVDLQMMENDAATGVLNVNAVQRRLQLDLLRANSF